MRILHLDTGSTFRGGQRQLLLLAQAQRLDPQLTVRVLAADARLLTRLTQAGLDAVSWPGPRPDGLILLARHLRRFRPDVVHAHDSRAHGAARLAARTTPLVVHRRIDDPPRDRPLTRWKYRRGRFICVSNAIRGVLAGSGVPNDRLHVVLSSVPAPPMPPERPLGARPPRLLALGALVDHKGHAVLLDALARTSGLGPLTLVGAGPLADRLRRQVDRLGLGDRVHLAGDVPADWTACDLFVHPSRTEGLGTAVLDAMAAGCPVLASRVGGLPEAVIDGETGWLVPADDPETLAAALDRVALLDPAHLRGLGLAGWRRVRERHGIEAMVAGTRAVYDRTLGGE